MCFVPAFPVPDMICCTYFKMQDSVSFLEMSCRVSQHLHLMDIRAVTLYMFRKYETPGVIRRRDGEVPAKHFGKMLNFVVRIQFVY